jgi:hypothetical protein
LGVRIASVEYHHRLTKHRSYTPTQGLTMNSVKTKIAALVAVLALGPLTAFAHDADSRVNPALGNAAQATAATHAVVIQTGTKSVNVDQGDVVTFQVAGQTFTWLFDTMRSGVSFDLAEIAPHGLDTQGVRVYVAPNPLYHN